MPSNLYELTKGPLYGVAPIGLAYWVTSQILSLLPNNSKNYFEGGLPDIFANAEPLRIFWTLLKYGYVPISKPLRTNHSLGEGNVVETTDG